MFFTETSNRIDFSNQIVTLLTSISNMLAPELTKQSFNYNNTSRRTYGFYPSYNLNDYLAALEFVSVRLSKAIRFLECGSGLGYNTFLASYAFRRSATSENRKKEFVGLELQPKLIDIADKLYVGLQYGLTFHEQDILKYTNYGGHNVFYWWYPISDIELYFKFVEKVLNDSEKDSFFIINECSAPRTDKKYINQIKLLSSFGTYNVYQKI